MYFDKVWSKDIGVVDNTASHTYTQYFGMPVDIKRLVLVCTTAATAGNKAMSISVGGTNIGSFTPAAAVAQGATLYVDFAAGTGPTTAVDGSITYAGGKMPHADPGQSIVISTANGAANGGVYEAFLEVYPSGYQEKASYAKAVAFVGA